RRFGTRRAALSLKAMRKILPNLTAGESYASACAKAGYHHSYHQSQLRARLPYYGEVLRGSTVGGTLKPGDPAERRWGRVTNITVHVALNRLRELVNTLIRRHGAPEQ